MTRNMLSQIENGSAHPSMKTLGYLAEQLGKPVSYFLEEQGLVSPNQPVMEAARAAFALGDWEQMRQALDCFREPDPLLYEERQLLEFYWHILRGKQAMETGMTPYGIKLMYRALELEGIYITGDLRYRCRVLLGMAGELTNLEADGDALLARAKQCPDPDRRMEILNAADDREDPRWNQLWADAKFGQKQYAEAAKAYRLSPESRENYGKLEICYRELGDYKQAYECACRQREMQ